MTRFFLNDENEKLIQVDDKQLVTTHCIHSRTTSEFIPVADKKLATRNQSIGTVMTLGQIGPTGQQFTRNTKLIGFNKILIVSFFSTNSLIVELIEATFVV